MTPLSRVFCRCLSIWVFALGCGGALSSPGGEGDPGKYSGLLDDHGDTPATATLLPASSGTFGGTLENSMDRDIFAFQSEARHYYRFHCTFPEPLVGWGLEHIDVNGERLEWVHAWISSGQSLFFKTHTAQTTYLKMFAVHEELSGSYNCVLEDVGQDDHGEWLATATPWLPGTQATGVLELRTDMDMFSRSLSHGAFHRVTCTSLDPAMPCLVKVLGPTGVASGEPAGTASFNATHDGTYRVEVTSAYWQIPIIRSAYTLQFETLGLDDHGDAREYATPLTPSSVPFTGQLSGGMDRDVFSFTTQVGHIYRFMCELLPGQSLGPTLFLTNATGQMVEASYSATNQASRVAVEAAAVAEYFVEVSSSPSYVGPYSCRFDDLGFDDHGNTLAAATAVQVPTLLTGHLETRLDVDVFSFPVHAGHSYSFVAAAAPGRAGVMRLKNAQGTVLQNLSNQSNFLAPQDSVYFLEVSVESFREAGTYSIQARDLGLDDHGNTPETATSLAPGQTLSGECPVSSDVDVFVFTMEANALYRVSCIDCNPTLQSPAGALRTLHTGQGSTRSYYLDAHVTAPVYVFTSADSYQLTLEYLGTDDHGDRVGDATPISHPVSLPAVLDSTYDVDVFSVSLFAGWPHRVRANAGFTTVVRVLAPDGTELPRSFEGNFTPTSSGVHHILVRPETASMSFSYGPYSLLLD